MQQACERPELIQSKNICQCLTVEEEAVTEHLVLRQGSKLA